MNLENLLAWSPSKTVNTRRGERLLRKASPTEQFWSLWKTHQGTLKEAGISVSRDPYSGEWEVCHWQPLAEQIQRERMETIAESKAIDASVQLPAPAGREYLPFQKAGIVYASDRRAVLIADEMGLGKTIQAIGLLNLDSTLRQVLIICPASLKLNWQRELKRWSCIDRIIGIVDNGKFWPEGDVIICNYDVVEKHLKTIKDIAWDCLIVDEAHYCKNPKAKRTKAILGDGNIQARRRVFLTGTPITNRPVELWPLVHALDPKDLGRHFFTFAKRYCNARENRWGWDFSGASNLDELQRKLREKFMVRRLKKDVLTELPPKRRQVIELAANGNYEIIAAERAAMEAQKERLTQLKADVELARASDNEEEYKEAVAALREGITAAFSEISALRHRTALAKVPAVIDHLKNSLEQGPVICFAHHKDVVAAITEAFPSAAVITGATKVEDRQVAVDRFQAGETDLFVGNILAAGVGITLTRSSHVVFAELDWVPANMTQAEDRCHRIGQTNSVLVQHLVLEESLDATMAKRLIDKQAVIDAALDTELDICIEPIMPLPNLELELEEQKQEPGLLPPEQVEALHYACRVLAGVCDGAVTRDNQGYNAFDATIGRTLASYSQLNTKQALLAQKILRKYHRQLGQELMDKCGITLKEEQ